MIEQIFTYFTIETLYMWINLGVLPFWLILIFFPQSYLSRFFVTSIFPFILMSGVYIFILYKSFLIGYDFDGNFNLYLGLNELSRLFEDSLYLMIFWTHFIAINLFVKTKINKIYNTFFSILLEQEREKNYQNCENRFEEFINKGAIEEVKFLKDIDPATVPTNLIIRISSHMIDQGPVKHWPWTSTVVTSGRTCPAPEQGNACQDCRAGWDRSTPNVAYGKH